MITEQTTLMARDEERNLTETLTLTIYDNERADVSWWDCEKKSHKVLTDTTSATMGRKLFEDLSKLFVKWATYKTIEKETSKTVRLWVRELITHP